MRLQNLFLDQDLLGSPGTDDLHLPPTQVFGLGWDPFEIP